MASVAEEKYLISLIKSVLSGSEAPKKPDDVDILRVFELAKLHGMIELVSYAVPSVSSQIDKGLLDAVERLKLLGVAKEIHQDAELSAISELFEKNGIDLALLKGSIIKRLYPSPDMRSMCDIDILIRKKDLSRADKLIMRELEFPTRLEGPHDISYKRPPFVNIELHYSITDEDLDKKAFKFFKNAWSLVQKSGDYSHIYELTGENFYIHHIEHMAKHYRFGGCGVRAFCDIFVYLNAYKDSLDWEYINESLNTLCLTEFARHAEAAAYKWFGDGEGDSATEAIERYIMSGGSYGTKERADIGINAVRFGKNRKISKSRRLMARVFPSFGVMKRVYPVLKKAPFLLPFMYPVRIISRLLFKKGRVKEGLETSKIQAGLEAHLNHLESVGLSI